MISFHSFVLAAFSRVLRYKVGPRSICPTFSLIRSDSVLFISAQNAARRVSLHTSTPTTLAGEFHIQPPLIEQRKLDRLRDHFRVRAVEKQASCGLPLRASRTLVGQRRHIVPSIVACTNCHVAAEVSNGAASHVGVSAIYPVQYDVLRDFEPVSMLGSTPLWIVARKSLPAQNLRELIAWLKANADKASAATVGPGSAAHLCGIYIQENTGTRFHFVPYRGGNQPMQDMIGERIDLMCDQASNSLSFVRSGQIKAFAVMAKKRWFASPDVPTVEEAGLPPLHFSFWHGLWTPRGTPKEIITKLNSAVADALANPTVQQRYVEMGLELPSREQQTPAALAAFHKAEIDKWWPIIKTAKIKLE